MRAVILHSISKTGSELIKNNDNKCMTGLYIDRPLNCLTINMSILNLVISTVLRRLQNHACTKGLVVITSYEGLRKHQVEESSFCTHTNLIKPLISSHELSF